MDTNKTKGRKISMESELFHIAVLPIVFTMNSKTNKKGRKMNIFLEIHLQH